MTNEALAPWMHESTWFGRFDSAVRAVRGANSRRVAQPGSSALIQRFESFAVLATIIGVFADVFVR